MTKQAGTQPGAPGARRDRLIREKKHDPYETRAKLPDPTACPDCGVMYRAGRWTRGAPTADAHAAVCPACQRIRDDYPAGILTLAGEFMLANREEILALAKHVAEREGAQHPLKRIMAVREEGDATVVTTTDAELARSIGSAIERAYQGEFADHPAGQEDLLRVSWKRG